MDAISMAREQFLYEIETLHHRYYRAFNSHPVDNRPLKFRLLRIEKIKKLIATDPQYNPSTCFTCRKQLPKMRRSAEPETIWCVQCVEEHERTTRARGGYQWMPEKHSTTSSLSK